VWLECVDTIARKSLTDRSIFGIFGSFTFYLPELFPTEVRGVGSGFCYNSGRVITAFGPFIIGLVSKHGINPLSTIQFVAIVPLIGALLAVLRVPVDIKTDVEYHNFINNNTHTHADGERSDSHVMVSLETEHSHSHDTEH